MLGRNLISLTSMIFCFLRASFFFFCSSYLYLPKSRILQTGGSAVGAISTRSRPASEAMVSASLRPTTPTMLPRSSTRRTRITPISSLIRGPSRVGVKFRGGLAIYTLLSWVNRSDHDRVGPKGRRRNRRFFLQSSNGFAERKDFLRLAAEPSQCNRPVNRFASPDDQQNRHLGKAVRAYLVADLLVAAVENAPEPGSLAFPHHVLAVTGRFFSNRGDDDLHRCQPQGKAAGIVLDQDADEALERAEDCSVQHRGAVRGAILANIARLEPLRQDKVELQGAALPVPAERVAQNELELGAIKGPLPRIERVGQARRLDRIAEPSLGAVPDLVRAGAHRR